MVSLLTLEPTFGISVLHTSLVNELVSAARVLNSVLPLEIKLMPFLMQPFELFCGFVKLDLRRLRLGNFLLQLACFASHLNSQFFDLKRQFLNLGLVSSPKLLQSQVVFFLLPRGKCPLF